MNLVVCVFILFISHLAWAVESAPRLTIRYNLRPPYITVENGKIAGVAATPALKVMEDSGIPFELVDTPVNRQLLVIFGGQGYDCSTSWFRTAEREKKAKFTEAISDDGPWVAVGHRGTVEPTLTNVRELLRNKKLRYLYQERFSNGPLLDQLIADLKPTRVLMEGDIETMLTMIKSGRADYFFLSDLEFRYLLEKMGLLASDFVVLKFSDLPENPKRYIMCSKKVPDSVIMRINKSIHKLRSH